MAYNNAFPMSYTPYIPSYTPQMQAPQMQTPQPTPAPLPQQQNSMIWVQGETGAKSYLVAPNTTLPLWDSEAQVIYLKSADASGMPTTKILDYTIREQTQAQKPVVAERVAPQLDFVTHDELQAFEDKITHKIDEFKESLKDDESSTTNANGKSTKK